MNSDAEEDFNINNEGEYSCSEEEGDENIGNIASIINTHGNSYIPGSEAVENVASLQSPDIIECDDFVNVVNVEAPKKKSKKTKEPIIKWQKKDLKPTLYEYKNEKCGVQLELSQSPSPLDIFECFFTNDFVERIIHETNRYHDYICTEKEIPHASRHNHWKESDVNEFFVFLGLSLLMPLVHKQKLNDYWSKD
ncbi:hypothetical protein JTB14_008578 [Gonioctena quinquepunctata]|nr:hypothetical protein JTB14_008578 [Gonioctena quinquepunctata]